MKIECIKDKLGKFISKTEKIVVKNLTLPVLSCILLEVKKNNLIIRSTNLDLGVELVLPVKVEKEGIVAVPASVLNNAILNIYNDKNVVLEVINENLSISTSSSNTLIKSMNYEDFPTIPGPSEDKKFKIYMGDFINSLKSVWYSSAVSSMKPELSSIYIYPDENEIVFVATDSFRLAEKRIKTKKKEDFSQILIPFKNIPDIIRVFEDVKEEVEISLDKNHISFFYDGFYLTSRVVDGIFPDYKQIIPKEFITEVVVLKQDLINALKMANVFSDSFKQVNIKVKPGKKLFEIKTKNNDVGENINKIEAACSGEDIDINLNYKYIIDCFQSIDSDSISLSFSAMNRPMIIKGVSDKTFTYLMMSMNR